MNDSQSGLSAVELLITLFIASMFLMSGYLLWGVTEQSSTDANRLSTASNIAYDYVQRYRVINGCNSPSVIPALVTNATPDNATSLPNAKVTVTATCPANFNGLNLVKITSTVTYSNPVKSVSHVLYAK